MSVPQDPQESDSDITSGRVMTTMRLHPETLELLDAWARRLTGRRGRKMSRSAVLEDLLLRARLPDDAGVKAAYGAFVERLGVEAPGWNVAPAAPSEPRYPVHDGGCAHGSSRVISGATPLRRCDSCGAVEGVDGLWRVL